MVSDLLILLLVLPLGLCGPRPGPGAKIVKMQCKEDFTTYCAPGGPDDCPAGFQSQTNVASCGFSTLDHYLNSSNIAGTCCYQRKAAPQAKEVFTAPEAEDPQPRAPGDPVPTPEPSVNVAVNLQRIGGYPVYSNYPPNSNGPGGDVYPLNDRYGSSYGSNEGYGRADSSYNDGYGRAQSYEPTRGYSSYAPPAQMDSYNSYAAPPISYGQDYQQSYGYYTTTTTEPSSSTTFVVDSNIYAIPVYAQLPPYVDRSTTIYNFSDNYPRNSYYPRYDKTYPKSPYQSYQGRNPYMPEYTNPGRISPGYQKPSSQVYNVNPSPAYQPLYENQIPPYPSLTSYEPAYQNKPRPPPYAPDKYQLGGSVPYSPGYGMAGWGPRQSPSQYSESVVPYQSRSEDPQRYSAGYDTPYAQETTTVQYVQEKQAPANFLPEKQDDYDRPYSQTDNSDDARNSQIDAPVRQASYQPPDQSGPSSIRNTLQEMAKQLGLYVPKPQPTSLDSVPFGTGTPLVNALRALAAQLRANDRAPQHTLDTVQKALDQASSSPGWSPMLIQAVQDVVNEVCSMPQLGRSIADTVNAIQLIMENFGKGQTENRPEPKSMYEGPKTQYEAPRSPQYESPKSPYGPPSQPPIDIPAVELPTLAAQFLIYLKALQTAPVSGRTLGALAVFISTFEMAPLLTPNAVATLSPLLNEILSSPGVSPELLQSTKNLQNALEAYVTYSTNPNTVGLIQTLYQLSASNVNLDPRVFNGLGAIVAQTAHLSSVPTDNFVVDELHDTLRYIVQSFGTPLVHIILAKVIRCRVSPASCSFIPSSRLREQSPYTPAVLPVYSQPPRLQGPSYFPKPPPPASALFNEYPGSSYSKPPMSYASYAPGAAQMSSSGPSSYGAKPYSNSNYDNKIMTQNSPSYSAPPPYSSSYTQPIGRRQANVFGLMDNAGPPEPSRGPGPSSYGRLNFSYRPVPQRPYLEPRPYDADADRKEQPLFGENDLASAYSTYDAQTYPSYPVEMTSNGTSPTLASFSTTVSLVTVTTTAPPALTSTTASVYDIIKNRPPDTNHAASPASAVPLLSRREDFLNAHSFDDILYQENAIRQNSRDTTSSQPSSPTTQSPPLTTISSVPTIAITALSQPGNSMPTSTSQYVSPVGPPQPSFPASSQTYSNNAPSISTQPILASSYESLPQWSAATSSVQSSFGPVPNYNPTSFYGPDNPASGLPVYYRPVQTMYNAQGNEMVIPSYNAYLPVYSSPVYASVGNPTTVKEAGGDMFPNGPGSVMWTPPGSNRNNASKGAPVMYKPDPSRPDYPVGQYYQPPPPSMYPDRPPSLASAGFRPPSTSFSGPPVRNGLPDPNASQTADGAMQQQTQSSSVISWSSTAAPPSGLTTTGSPRQPDRPSEFGQLMENAGLQNGRPNPNYVKLSSYYTQNKGFAGPASPSWWDTPPKLPSTSLQLSSPKNNPDKSQWPLPPMSLNPMDQYSFGSADNHPSQQPAPVFSQSVYAEAPPSPNGPSSLPVYARPVQSQMQSYQRAPYSADSENTRPPSSDASDLQASESAGPTSIPLKENASAAVHQMIPAVNQVPVYGQSVQAEIASASPSGWGNYGGYEQPSNGSAVEYSTPVRNAWPVYSHPITGQAVYLHEDQQNTVPVSGQPVWASSRPLASPSHPAKGPSDSTKDYPVYASAVQAQTADVQPDRSQFGAGGSVVNPVEDQNAQTPIKVFSRPVMQQPAQNLHGSDSDKTGSPDQAPVRNAWPVSSQPVTGQAVYAQPEKRPSKIPVYGRRVSVSMGTPSPSFYPPQATSQPDQNSLEQPVYISRVQAQINPAQPTEPQSAPMNSQAEDNDGSPSDKGENSLALIVRPVMQNNQNEPEPGTFENPNVMPVYSQPLMASWSGLTNQYDAPSDMEGTAASRLKNRTAILVGLSPYYAPGTLNRRPTKISLDPANLQTAASGQFLNPEAVQNFFPPRRPPFDGSAKYSPPPPATSTSGKVPSRAGTQIDPRKSTTSAVRPVTTESATIATEDVQETIEILTNDVQNQIGNASIVPARYPAQSPGYEVHASQVYASFPEQYSSEQTLSSSGAQNWPVYASPVFGYASNNSKAGLGSGTSNVLTTTDFSIKFFGYTKSPSDATEEMGTTEQWTTTTTTPYVPRTHKARPTRPVTETSTVPLDEITCGIPLISQEGDLSDIIRGNRLDIRGRAGLLDHRYKRSLGDREERIVSGITAREREICWMAALTLDDKYIAGASIIADRYILTAAHVVDGREPSRMKVVIGTTDVRYKKTPKSPQSCRQTLAVERVILYPDYLRKTLSGDLALVKLRDPIDFNSSCVCTLCMQDTGPQDSDMCIVSGFGSTRVIDPFQTASELEAFQRSGPNAEILRYIGIPVVPNDDCTTTFKDERLRPDKNPAFTQLDSNTQMCAGGVSRMDSCFGDGGSPLVCYDGSSFYQAGLVSFGRGCGRALVPAVYAKTTGTVYNWIQHQTIYQDHPRSLRR